MLIDSEIRLLIERSATEARTILTSHMDQLKHLADALLESETLSGEEIDRLLSREVPLARDPTMPKPGTASGRSMAAS